PALRKSQAAKAQRNSSQRSYPNIGFHDAPLKLERFILSLKKIRCCRPKPAFSQALFGRAP
ncbi:MAG: hypothetical protein WAW46_14515, partial [Polaromonas sp.]